LIVENKARGHDVVKEIKRLHADRNWGCVPVDVHGDKWSRGHSVVDLFTDGMVHVPAEITEAGDVRFLDWAQTAMLEVCGFPRRKHDDLYDAVIMGLRYLRNHGYAIRKDEARVLEDARQRKSHTPRPSIYNV
jgi:phage terminase large subunit-like protein